MKNVSWASRGAVGAALTGLFATSIVFGAGSASAETAAPEQEATPEAYEAHLAELAGSDPVAAEALQDYRALSQDERQEVVDITSDPEALREISEALPQVEPGEQVELHDGDIVLTAEIEETETSNISQHDYVFTGEISGVPTFQLTTWVRWETLWEEDDVIPPFEVEASGSNSNVYAPYFGVDEDHRGAEREDEFNARVSTNWEFTLTRWDWTIPLWSWQQRIDLTSTTLGVLPDESMVEI